MNLMMTLSLPLTSASLVKWVFGLERDYERGTPEKSPLFGNYLEDTGKGI